MDRQRIRETEKNIIDWFDDTIFPYSNGVAFEFVFIKYLEDGNTLKRDSGVIFWDKRSLRSALFRSKAVFLNLEKQENVYFRIHKESAIPAFIWLDDVSEGHATIQTSENSYQAFVPYKGKKVGLEDYKRAKDALIALWGADPGAKAHRQPMRFPFTFSWKHNPPYWVTHLRKLDPIYITDVLKNAVSPASFEAGTTATKSTPVVKEGVDHSREDFIAVLKKLSKGESYVSIYNWLYNKVMMENAQGIRNKKNPRDYVERTIRKAQEIHERRENEARKSQEIHR